MRAGRHSESFLRSYYVLKENDRMAHAPPTHPRAPYGVGVNSYTRTHRTRTSLRASLGHSRAIATLSAPLHQTGHQISANGRKSYASAECLPSFARSSALVTTSSCFSTRNASRWRRSLRLAESLAWRTRGCHAFMILRSTCSVESPRPLIKSVPQRRNTPLPRDTRPFAPHTRHR